MKAFRIIMAAWLALGQGTAWATPVATNEELLTQILELKKMVESQNQKISVLEGIVFEGKGAARSMMTDDQAQDMNSQLEKRLSDASRGYQTIGGLTLGGSATMVGQQAFNANKNTDKKHSDSNDASYSVDLTLEKEFDEYGKAFLHVETGDGTSGDRRMTLFSSVNRDADDSDHMLHLTEAWYEHYLFNKQLTAKLGQLDASIEMDENEFAHDETSQFLSSIFRNSPVIDFPGNHLGGKLLWTPEAAQWIEFSGGYLDGDGDGDSYSSTGFAFTQFNMKPLFLGDSRPGNYRVYTWRSERNHTKWLDASETGDAGFGFGISMDQRLTDTVGVFARYGWQDPAVYLLEQSWSVGLRFEGSAWNRLNDHIGLAFGEAIPGKNWRIQGDSLETPIWRDAETERHMELYYSYQVNDHLTVSPNFQWIWNPYGMDTNPSSAEDLEDLTTVTADHSSKCAYLLGARVQLNF